MNSKTIIVLGGYGNTGSEVAKLILQETTCHVIIAGRSIEKAGILSKKLNIQFNTERVTPKSADASDPTSLVSAFQGAHIVIVCSGTAEHTTTVASVALDMGIDYFDIHFSSEKQAQLLKLKERIEIEGRCFITEGGFHPGLPAVLVHYASSYFDKMVNAYIGSVIKIDWANHNMAASTVQEFLKEIMEIKPIIYKDKVWTNAKLYGMFDAISMNFGDRFGKQSCIPMFLEELRELPVRYPSLKNTGFYVGGFNWFIDWIFIPLASLVLSISPKKSIRKLASIMGWGLIKFSKPPFGTKLKLEASGMYNGRVKNIQITLSHQDGYIFTAIPVVSSLLQYLKGNLAKSGLWMQAHIVDPNQMITDMERLGIKIEIKES
jgi:saccharopine dehydrogenase (NAD+, L-lysine-forming)